MTQKYLNCWNLPALGYTGPHCVSCHEDADQGYEMAGTEWGEYWADVCCDARAHFDWSQTPPEETPDLAGSIEY
jgi:hypothetical protein